MLRSHRIRQDLNKIQLDPARGREGGRGRGAGSGAGGPCTHPSTVQNTRLFCSCVDVYFKCLHKITENYKDKWLENPSFSVFTVVQVVQQTDGIRISVIAGHLQVFCTYLMCSFTYVFLIVSLEDLSNIP